MDPSSPAATAYSQHEDMLTPRTKVAKMLADIDDAPTPSPPGTLNAGEPPHEHASKSSPVKPSLPAAVRPPFEEQPGSDSEDEDNDIVRKPQGRIARRMLNGIASSPPLHIQNHPIPDAYEDDELYTATLRKNTTAGSSPASRRQGSGLFVSPSKSIDEESDEELPSNPFGTKEKLQAMVARKRAERLAREAEESEMRQAASSDLPDEAFEGSQAEAMDANVEKILSDASRPARKASKRALLEMERETQRLDRQRALAHQMRTKQKFTTSGLMAKFNFRKAVAREHESPNAGADDTTGSSAPSSDGPEERAKHPVSTPPSSPPTPLDRQKALVERGALSKLMPVRQDSIVSLAEVDLDEELPDVADIVSSARRQMEASEASAAEDAPKKGLKLARLGKKAAVPQQLSSEDELEIVPAMPSHLRAFEKAMGAGRSGKPADSRAIHNLKHLSHLHNQEVKPRKKGIRPSIDPTSLEAQLRRRAREQARLQQLERIEELRAKGIDVQTVEDREKEAEEFEDLLERARSDAVELRKAEKTARQEAGEEVAGDVSEDEDDDQDYVGSGSEIDEQEGSEDEQEIEADGLVDEAAEEDADDENDEVESDADIEPTQDDVIHGTGSASHMDATEVEGAASWQDTAFATPALASRRVKKLRVVQDDEDDLDFEEDTRRGGADEVTSKDDPFAAFNFGGTNQGPALMSPTQAFNATMQTPSQATQKGSFDMLRYLAPPSLTSLPPTLPDIDTQIDESQPDFVAGSQVPESQRVNLNWETQPPETPGHSAVGPNTPSLNETPGWEPTQDRGLPSPWSVPKLARTHTIESVEEQDTQSTVQLRVSESPAPSLHMLRKGRLARRRAPAQDDSDEDDGAPPPSLKLAQKNAFREMAKRRKEAMSAVEKAEIDKEMRQMMDEQAEESEDEYAGLGGDDFVAPETEQDREMIDSSHVDVDERAIAAHFAERERLREEKETSKLYNDLVTGQLRRKMAANAFDLDEDEDEIATRRRKMRQMEEAKKRKALLKDDNIASLASGKHSKGKEAFLKAIADDDGDNELFEVVEDDSAAATQDEDSQSQQVDIPPLQETSGNKRKSVDEHESRPPAKQRRTQPSELRRPTSMLELKESVSFLLEDSHSNVKFGPTALEADPDSEGEYGHISEEEAGDEEVEMEQARENDGGFAPDQVPKEQRTMPPPRPPAPQRRTAPKPAVVDRLTLKRNASSGSDSAHGRTAWAAGPSTDGFKVPSLLRRATTNTASLSNSRGVSTPSLSRENSGVKMGGSKKSSLAYQARAEERKAIVEASAKRREENTARIAQMRRSSESALGRGLAGRFE